MRSASNLRRGRENENISLFSINMVFSHQYTTSLSLPGYTYNPLYCNEHVCRTHLRAVSLTSTITNLEIWKNSTAFDWNGNKFGGQPCEVVHMLGILISIPIFLYFLKCIHIFYRDWRTSTASLFEIPFVVLQLYPQIRVIKYWVQYYYKHGDQGQLEKDKAAYEREVETIEPYLESLPQVK